MEHQIVFLTSWSDCDACISEVKGLLFLYEPERWPADVDMGIS